MRKLLVGLAAAVAISSPAVAQPLDAAAARTAIAAEFAKNWPELDSLYRDLHQHPELSFEEVRSSGLLASRMRKLGFEVTEKVGVTGVVAIYRNGSGPVVMVRADMDALPMEEKTGLPYASRAEGILDGKQTFITHSCGHDNHMAWWIGTAATLVAMKDRWKGTLMFVAQPAEERGGGANRMMKDGLFTRFPKPDVAFAAHVGNQLAGTVTIKDGSVNSSADGVQITFKGQGAHGSNPSASIDPVVMGSRFVMDVQTIISREKDAGAFGVVTVGAFQAGSVGNIIPDQAVLRLTLRSFTPEVRQLLIDGVDRTATAVAEMARAPAPEIVHSGGTAAVVNDTPLAEKTYAVMKAAIGDQARFVPASAPGSSTSEDFSVYGEAGVPSLFIRIGGYPSETIADYKKRGEKLPTNHSPFFAPDHRSAIETGTLALSLAVLGVMADGKSEK